MRVSFIGDLPTVSGGWSAAHGGSDRRFDVKETLGFVRKVADSQIVVVSLRETL